MKKLFILCILVLSFSFVFGCNKNPEPDDGGKVADNEGDGNKQDEIKYLTVTEAYQKAVEAGESGTTDRHYVYGTVKNITNSVYGEMYITDGTTDLHVYGVYSSDGELKYSEMEEKPYSGDEVYLHAILKTYKGTPELGSSHLVKFVSHQSEIDLNDYTEVTIDNARKAEVDSKVIVNGVVSCITYANGMKPNGIYLVDETGSIYIYSVEVAGRVKIGDKVKIAGTKTLYILDSEKDNAAIFGYTGSIQLQDAIFVSKESENNEFNKSWIETSTVKKMISTPMSENITTNIYKVKAIINRVPGSGFVNYYIDDLDNKTGSYCYSLCNGGDFSYLNEFDGKICDVYLSALNCKATKSGTVYRFVPILVEVDEDFTMTDEEICDFALEYFVRPQFRAEYDSNPELDLITSANSELLKFSGVEITYESQNNLVSFDERGPEDLVMNLEKGSGDIKITVSAKYKGKSASLDIEFKLNDKDVPTTLTISEAIAAQDGTTVTVRGIVMSGCVNQTAFYLNDGTGVIAVRTDSATIKNIGLGNDIIITGNKCHVLKEGSSMVGQVCIDNATLDLNLLGNHEYDTSTFITDKTFADLLELIQKDEDLTTNVYVVKCYLKKVESQYYTNFYLTDETKTKDIYLYAGSGSQYSIYNEFLGDTELTVTLMLVNWNSKMPYRACIISASNGEKEILNNYNFR